MFILVKFLEDLCSLHNLGQLHTRAKGHEHVIVRTLDSRPNDLPLTRSTKICVRPYHWYYLLEFASRLPLVDGLDHETLFLIYYVGLSSMLNSLGSHAFAF